MFDFRLKVFYTVAQRLSFTKAAEELYISQPAVTSHIKAIEKHYGCKLFKRKGPTISLTAQGHLLLEYATGIFTLQKELETKLMHFSDRHKGMVKLGASTTAAQYVLPKYLAEFKTVFPSVELEMEVGNTAEIENKVLNETLEIGFVEGKSDRSNLHYVPFLKDEIVLCTSVNTPISPVISVDQLKTIPFVLREHGSGTRDIIATKLLEKNIKIEELQTVIELENNESIKSYLVHSNAFVFISISAITNELRANKLKIIDVETVNMERFFYSIQRKDELQDVANTFLRYIYNYNF